MKAFSKLLITGILLVGLPVIAGDEKSKPKEKFFKQVYNGTIANYVAPTTESGSGQPTPTPITFQLFEDGTLLIILYYATYIGTWKHCGDDYYTFCATNNIISFAPVPPIATFEVLRGQICFKRRGQTAQVNNFVATDYSNPQLTDLVQEPTNPTLPYSIQLYRQECN